MPFIPFILGAAIGSAVTYTLKDDSSKQMLKDTGDKVKGGVGALTGKVTGLFKKGSEEVEEIAEEAAEASEDAVAA